MKTGNERDYVLGHSEAELRRLARQHAFIGDLTADVLRRAGLSPGMKVLDIGCGAGDVSLLAATLVGDAGAVTGVDRAPEAIERARQRALTEGLRRVEFIQAECDAFESAQRFDALIGRLVLMYLPDPAAVLRHLVRLVRPGGIVTFQELDMATTSSFPEVPLYTTCRHWIASTFERAGFESRMGSKLFSAFRAAGLPAPEMIATARLDGSPDSPGYEYVTEVVRALLPTAERLGVVSADEVGIDTLAARLRSETLAAGACLRFPLFVGAWTKVPN